MFVDNIQVIKNSRMIIQESLFNLSIPVFGVDPLFFGVDLFGVAGLVFGVVSTFCFGLAPFGDVK